MDIKCYEGLERELVRRHYEGIGTLVYFYGKKDKLKRKKEIDLYVYVDNIHDDGDIKRVFNITKTPTEINVISTKITSIQHDDN